MEKLRQLMLTDITSKATYQAQQASSAQADGDMNDTFFTSLPDRIRQSDVFAGSTAVTRGD